MRSTAAITTVGDHTATLAIIAAPSGSSKKIPLSHRIVGSVLSASSTDVHLAVLDYSTRQQDLDLVNTGNAIATITTVPAIVMQSGATVRVLPNPFQVLAGSSTGFSVSASGGSMDTQIEMIAMMSAGNQCSESVPVRIFVEVSGSTTTGTTAP